MAYHRTAPDTPVSDGLGDTVASCIYSWPPAPLSFFLSFFFFSLHVSTCVSTQSYCPPRRPSVTPLTSAFARARLCAGTSVPALLSRVRLRAGTSAPVPSCPLPCPHFCSRLPRPHTSSSSAVAPRRPPPSPLVVLPTPPRPVLPRPVPPRPRSASPCPASPPLRLAPPRLAPSPHHHTHRPPIALLHPPGARLFK